MIRHVAVIDIGKTNAKVALVDLAEMREVAVRKTPNAARTDGPYPHHDVDRLWAFMLDAFADLNNAHGIDAISITTHGATAALLDRWGKLAMPVLDYEHDGPEETRGAYEAVRPDFSETGSPALPNGLNIGPQLFWQARRFPQDFDTVARIVMYPQFWAYRLTGVLANEVTSLGCHTDLWNPGTGDYSSLVDRMGWRPLFAPVRRASDTLGVILPDVAAKTELPGTTPVVCGLHDSNASLLPHLLSRNEPFTVVSTGTWVVSMAVGAPATPLDPGRDTLINVNALGDPVPSARFMGGREYETLGGAAFATPESEDVAGVLNRKIALLPSIQPGCGPYPASKAAWTAEPATPGERSATVSFYLALMTASCLDLIGAAGETIVEGPFARNELYCRMLATATGRPVAIQSGKATGTSIGAALLIETARSTKHSDKAPRRHPRPEWRAYAERWQALAAGV